MKKLRPVLQVAIVVLSFVPLISFAQGSLTPPGAPAPTMKSLSQIEPRIPIYTIPTNLTVSGAYYLTTNLTGTASANGITIYTNDITIDLAGFTLIGVPSSFNGIIFNGSYSNVLIKNGSLKNWSEAGIDLSAGSHNTFDHLSISGCGSDGLNSGTYDTLICCSSVNNTLSGFSLGYYNLVDHCMSSINGAHGYVLSPYAKLTDSSSLNNKAVGIYLQGAGALVDRCNSSGNGTSGIYVAGPDCMVMNNEVAQNNTTASAVNAGIYIAGQNSRIDGNHIGANSIAGVAIASGWTGNVIVRNSASGNPANYNLQTGNDVGPIGTATNSTSPWANISN